MKLLLTFLTSILLLTQTSGQTIWVADINNLTVSGPVVGNRDFAFGVRNILEELLQDKEYDLDPSSDTQLTIDIVYFDVKKTSVQMAAYNKSTDVTEIIFKATIQKNGKELKPVVAKGQAKSVSTSTLILDKGGKFSQTDVSTALKKVCEEIITKLKL